jgi:hypothetical protein
MRGFVIFHAASAASFYIFIKMILQHNAI